eukprot:3941822-Rhodomonas_salina.2
MPVSSGQRELTSAQSRGTCYVIPSDLPPRARCHYSAYTSILRHYPPYASSVLSAHTLSTTDAHLHTLAQYHSLLSPYAFTLPHASQELHRLAQFGWREGAQAMAVGPVPAVGAGPVKAVLEKVSENARPELTHTHTLVT